MPFLTIVYQIEDLMTLVTRPKIDQRKVNLPRMSFKYKFWTFELIEKFESMDIAHASYMFDFFAT